MNRRRIVAFYKELVPLRDLLAELFPTSSTARTVVAEAGIPEQFIDFEGAAVEFWKNILAIAQNNHQIQEIIDVARKRFPHNQPLIAAAQEHETTATAGLTQESQPQARQGGINFVNSTVTISGDIVGGDKNVTRMGSNNG
jgi:hypothetical protein